MSVGGSFSSLGMDGEQSPIVSVCSLLEGNSLNTEQAIERSNRFVMSSIFSCRSHSRTKVVGHNFIVCSICLPLSVCPQPHASAWCIFRLPRSLSSI